MRATAVLTGDRGGGGVAVEFTEGEVVAVLQTVSGGQQEKGRARGHVGVVRGRVMRGDGEKAVDDDSGTLLEGGGRNAAERGWGVGRHVEGEQGRERGPGHGGDWLRWPTSVPGRLARAAALPRGSVGRWDVGDMGVRD
jgi:hypothetical protein